MGSEKAAIRVTVVIPTYNRCGRLLETLHALSACDVAGLDVEAHVIDDGSTDGTGRAVAAFVENVRGPIRFRYERQENAGPAAARNRAVFASTAPIIVFLDDDCVPVPGWLRALVERLDDPAIVGAGGRFVAGREDTVVARFLRYLGVNEYPSATRPFRFALGGNSAFRREVLVQLGGFDATFRAAAAEDTDLGRRMCRAGYRVAYEPAAEVRDHNIESLASLIGRAFHRGQDSVLKRALWNQGQGIFPGMLKDIGRVMLHALTFPLSPLRAVLLLRRGVPAGDAFAFALLVQIQRLSRRSGCVAMAVRLRLGWRLPSREDPRIRRAPSAHPAPTTPEWEATRSTASAP